MIDPISSKMPPVSKTSTPAQAPANAQPKPEATPAKPDLQNADTVELSQQAQARLLREQGMGIPQIAMQLRLDVKTVTSFFPLSQSKL
jgi:hypothetical protein